MSTDNDHQWRYITARIPEQVERWEDETPTTPRQPAKLRRQQTKRGKRNGSKE